MKADIHIQKFKKVGHQVLRLAPRFFEPVDADPVPRKPLEKALHLRVIESDLEEWVVDSEFSRATSRASLDMLAKGRLGQSHGQLVEVLRESPFGGISQHHHDPG